jgi:hypothetical protein
MPIAKEGCSIAAPTYPRADLPPRRLDQRLSLGIPFYEPIRLGIQIVSAQGVFLTRDRGVTYAPLLAGKLSLAFALISTPKVHQREAAPTAREKITVPPVITTSDKSLLGASIHLS